MVRCETSQRAFRPVDLTPYFRVVPAEGALEAADIATIRIRDRGAFGTGRHETTQLCLLALGYLLRGRPNPTVLDVGAGSGILSIGAALYGAKVEAVEIDPAALKSARENVRLNGIENAVTVRNTFREPAEPFDLVVANILRDVLLDLAEPLCKRVASRGHLVLSGLTGTDVPAIVARYRKLLVDKRVEVYERGLWRAVMFLP